MKISEIFDGAADLIAKPMGWVKGRMSIANPRFLVSLGAAPYGYCILGAMQEATNGAYALSENYSKVGEIFFEEIGYSPVTFNDRISTSKKHVIGTLRKCAVEARRREALDTFIGPPQDLSEKPIIGDVANEKAKELEIA